MAYVILILAALGAMIALLQPGEWAMLGALVVMIVVHELAHLICARWFGMQAEQFTFGFGSTPRWYLGKWFNTEFYITPWLFGGRVEIDPAHDSVRTKPAWQRVLVIMSGTILNLVLAVALMFVLFASKGEQEMVPDGVSVQTVVSQTSSASQAGLQVGDLIVSVDGAPIKSYHDLHAALIAHSDGSGAAIVIERQGQDEKTVTVYPDAKGLIGVRLAYKMKAVYHRMSVVAAAKRSVSAVVDMGGKFLAGVLMIVHLLPVPQGALGGYGDAHGLLSMIQLGGIAFQQGVYSFFNMVAFCSVSLAFCYLIPLPTFDGGDLVFYFWEKLTGRPVPKELRSKMAKIIFWIVVAVMIYATVNDVVHPVA